MEAQMISVIIPSYNRETTIKRSVQSVLNQSYTDLEVIVVDDCSTDDTSSVVNRIMARDNRVKYIKHEINAGACAARNTGIAAASGEYIAFQDSDDSWRKDKLKIQMETMKRFQADVCICKMKRHYRSNNRTSIYPNVETGLIEYMDIIKQPLVSTQMILAKREVFADHIFDIKVKRMQDFDWSVRAARDYSFCMAGEVLVDQYIQQDSMMLSDYRKSIESYEYFLEKYSDLCREHPEFYAGILLRLGNCKLLHGIDATEDYKIAYGIKKDRNTFIKYLIAKLHLSSLYRMARRKTMVQ